MDVRKMFDKAYIYAYDLEGKDVTVEITRVVAGKLTGQGGKSDKKPVLYFKGTEKALGLNITNARQIAALYGGFDSEKWIGKRITLYPTTTQFGSQTVECIRIRPVVPKERASSIRSDVPQPATATPETVETPDHFATPGEKRAASELGVDDIPFGGGR